MALSVKYVSGAAAAVAAIVLSSCARFEFVIEEPPVPDAYEIRCEAEGMSMKVVTTRASDPKTDEEKRINQLYIFFFDSNGDYIRSTEGRFIGFQKPSPGQTVWKVDRDVIPESDKSAVTVYAVANVDPDIMKEDSEGKPVCFRNLNDLKEYRYEPDDLGVNIPKYGIPMVGYEVVDFSAEKNNTTMELKALMARVDLDISLDSEITENNLPALTMSDWTVRNVPTYVYFEENENAVTAIESRNDTTHFNIPLSKVIYNRNGSISISFYMFENIQERDDDNPYWVEMGRKYPEFDGGNEYQKQRYKPYRAGKAAAFVELHTYYSTYNSSSNSATYEVRYRLYLGANYIDDFKVKRNHQYKNGITIKGLTQAGTNPEHVTFDARVDIRTENNRFYIAMLRERNHDAHFCVTPMDVYLFADKEKFNPAMEVILGECAEGSENPDPETVPEWIRMERIPAGNMAAGTVPDSYDKSRYIVCSEDPEIANPSYHAGNGKRKYFTTGLLSELGTAGQHVTVDSSRDRVYFYLDENIDKDESGELLLKDRSAVVTLVYKENGNEVSRRTIELVQTYLRPVKMRDGGTLYMEAYEEYLDYYDPLDEFASEQKYDGLPWAEQNSPLDDYEIPRLHKDWLCLSSYEKPGQIFNDGFAYTGFIINLSAQDEMKLNDKPSSAFQYCFNKNKRDESGFVPVDYGERTLMGHYEIENKSKWFLPGIRQMEDALTQYVNTYSEFSEYYWSSSAGERAGDDDGQNPERARATRVNSDGSYVESGGGAVGGWTQFAYEYGNGGYAKRTEVLRIRAFRNDIEPADY